MVTDEELLKAIAYELYANWQGDGSPEEIQRLLSLGKFIDENDEWIYEDGSEEDS